MLTTSCTVTALRGPCDCTTHTYRLPDGRWWRITQQTSPVDVNATNQGTGVEAPWTWTEGTTSPQQPDLSPAVVSCVHRTTKPQRNKGV